MRSVEVVLDDDSDAQIRAQWLRLAAAGLPSQAAHTGASNRPHITLALAEAVTGNTDARLAAALSDLPLPVTIGGLLVFGARRFVLARLAGPSIPLLALQERVVLALDGGLDPHGTFGAGRWTPHVTLARRLTADQLGSAIAVLGDLPAIDSRLVRARQWDMSAKQEFWVPSWTAR